MHYFCNKIKKIAERWGDSLLESEMMSLKFFILIFFKRVPREIVLNSMSSIKIIVPSKIVSRIIYTMSVTSNGDYD